MRKLLLIPLVLALLLASAAPGLAGPGKTGFKLTGANAAYADFADGDCALFVGYVWAKKLTDYDSGMVHRPHSDLEVKLIGDCGGLVDVDMEGVVGTVGDTRAEIVKLTSAFVEEIEIELETGVIATVDLTWTATGPVFKEKIREPGVRANHRTRLAEVEGTVTITKLGVPWLEFGLDQLQDGARITHYNERNQGTP